MHIVRLTAILALLAASSAAAVGTQTSELITLLPATPTFRVINEDTPGNDLIGQYRLELDSVGSAES